ncbi:MAG: hypothetical protein KAS67_02025 [Thermoplasmata archaeon]|nr:hypothetical protein [Thermoplasmata archaeon]
MGIFDKTKEAAKKGLDKGVDLGKRGVDKGIEVGKKGVDHTKEAVRKKECSECKHYTPKDETSGSCPIGGERLASADSAACPQNAFDPK